MALEPDRYAPSPPAAVAELVDAQASGACGLRPVEVQVLSAALASRTVLQTARYVAPAKDSSRAGSPCAPRVTRRTPCERSRCAAYSITRRTATSMNVTRLRSS